MTSYGVGSAALAAVAIVTFAAVGAAVAGLVLWVRLGHHSARLVRVNVRGREVPAVLGDALVTGALVGSVAVLGASLEFFALTGETLAVPMVVGVMWGAGAWDDRRGDEPSRGFKGHLGALRSRTLSGGLVKIVAGAIAGLLAAAFLPLRGAAPPVHVVQSVALVGLSANLFNLLDRAPGRAAKTALLVGVPLAVLGSFPWAITAAPVLGALLFCMVPDLRERAMLGDAGANPLGAVLGVGLVTTLGSTGRFVAMGFLLALNLASEKWSFSKAIEATAPLRWLDGLGRRDQVAPK